MLSLLLAASFTFSATATGLEKGVPVEFYWVDRNSDRDYESLFVLDRSLKDFRRDLEKLGLKRGKAVDNAKCVLWPVGCTVSVKPALEDFVSIKLPPGFEPSLPIYTGGTEEGTSGFAFYSMSEAAIVFNGNYPQGDVYGAYTVKRALKKGEKVDFTISWEDKTYPQTFDLLVSTTNLVEVIKNLRTASAKGELEVKVTLDGAMTIREAQAVANALQVLDSPTIKMNGVKEGCLFFKAFLPKIAWLTRKDRLVQPFELTIGETPDKDQLVFVEEDWTAEGDDPKLTLKTITFEQAKSKETTNTCFVFASPSTSIARIQQSMQQLKGSSVSTWYVYEQ